MDTVQQGIITIITILQSNQDELLKAINESKGDDNGFTDIIKSLVGKGNNKRMKLKDFQEKISEIATESEATGELNLEAIKKLYNDVYSN